MKNKSDFLKKIKNIKLSKRAIIAIITLVILPVTVLAIYITHQYLSKASEAGCYPVSIKTQRDAVSGTVIFETECEIQAKIYCSTEKDGTYDYCGQDQTAKTNHEITTDASKLLETGQGYYVKVNSGEFYETLTYIFPEEGFKMQGFGSDLFNNFNTPVYGSCQGDESYDPQYDFNFDGCVMMSDLAETIETQDVIQ